MTIRWLSDDYLMTIRGLSDDYLMTSNDYLMTIKWLSNDYLVSNDYPVSNDYTMTIQWLSNDNPMNHKLLIQWLSSIQWLYNDYPMTIQWITNFWSNLLRIVDLKRSIDQRWLFKSGATFIPRWSCLTELWVEWLWDLRAKHLSLWTEDDLSNAVSTQSGWKKYCALISLKHCGAVSYNINIMPWRHRSFVLAIQSYQI